MSLHANVPYLDLLLSRTPVSLPLAAVDSRLLNLTGWYKTWSCAEQGAGTMSTCMNRDKEETKLINYELVRAQKS